MQPTLSRFTQAHTGRTSAEYLQIAGLYALMILGVIGTIVGAVGTVLGR